MLTRPVKKGYDLYDVQAEKYGVATGDEAGDYVRVKYTSGEEFYVPIDKLINARDASEEGTYFGKKADNGKPRMDLLLAGVPNALEGVAEVLTFGAKKYAAHSWKTVPDAADRYLAALMRHLIAHGKGELVDPESGQSHLSHAACNALFILELEKTK